MVIELYEQITDSTLSRISYLVDNAQGDLTLRINSSGGDVFSALSIYNLIKGKCTVEIVGLCASAATIVACAGTKVKMASNALYMIHSPKTLLIDYYNKQSLEKLTTTLDKVEESIMQAYRTRVENFQMPAEDLWLTAQEAKSLGFVDEIMGEVPVVVDSAQIFINSISYDAGKIEGLKERVHPTPKTEAALEQILKLIKDQMTSGGQKVGSQVVTTEEIRQMQLNKMIAFANKGVI